MRCSHSKVVTASPFHSRAWSISISRIRSAGIPWVSRRNRQTSGEPTSVTREVFMRAGTSWMWSKWPCVTKHRSASANDAGPVCGRPNGFVQFGSKTRRPRAVASVKHDQPW